jgi:DNA replication and repair protein RecF
VTGSATPQRVERLLVRGFRNLEPLDLAPGPRFNVVHGENGAGKSSLLEAVHYLVSLTSFRNARTEDLIRVGETHAKLDARIAGEVIPRRFTVELDRSSARKVEIDAKRPRSIAHYHVAVKGVVFHPGDLALATGSAEGRRAYLDRILAQMDMLYATTRVAYDKALRSRNRLLKEERVDRRSVHAFDEILSATGSVIVRCRAELVADLAPRVERAFSEVVGEEVPLTVRYKPRVSAEGMRKALAESFEKDRARGFTADGPHADELALSVRDVAARHHASQGQHRVMVLALKVAELDVLAARTNRVPVLLLDDLSSELDRERNLRFFRLLARMGGQVFLSTTHPELIRLEEAYASFEVQHGRVFPR